MLSAVLVFFIFKIHMSSDVDSMLNEKNNVISNVFLTSQINYHKEFAPFARRPLTTFLIERTASWLGTTMGMAFIWVNFSLLFLSGILLFRLSRVLEPGFLKGIFNVIIYFLSFSVLFAFFPPVFSYDEPLQYCLIFAGLISFLKKQWTGYVLWFTAAMIARENSAFLVLGLALCDVHTGFNYRKILSFRQLGYYILIGLPILLYMAFIVFYIEVNELWEGTQDEFHTRFSCFKENFKDTQSAIESVVSVLLTLGVFIYFLIASFTRHNPAPAEKKFVHAFILSSVVNTLIVLVAAFSREARLFALPLVFLWPLMAHYCYREIRLLLTFNTYFRCFANWKYSASFGILTLVNYLISFTVYVPSFPSSDNYFNEYLFLSVQLMCLHYLLRHYVNRNPGAYTPFAIGLKRQLR